MEDEQDDDCRAGEDELGHHEWPGAMAQEPGHDGVFLGGTALDQVEGEQAVRDAQDREQHDRDQEPGAVLVDIDEFFLVAVPAG